MGMLGLKPGDTGSSDAERAASEEAGEEPGCMQRCAARGRQSEYEEIIGS